MAGVQDVRAAVAAAKQADSAMSGKKGKEWEAANKAAKDAWTRAKDVHSRWAQAVSKGGGNPQPLNYF